MKLSVVIPTLNEEQNILQLITLLNRLPKAGNELEIIIVDAGSEDNTIQLVKQTNAALVNSKEKSRAVQMNLGAENATGEVIYFLHADTIPPVSLVHDLSKAIDEGYSAGSYRLVFDINHWFLSANAWFSKFNLNAFRYGDQSLFVEKSVFQHIKGFNTGLRLFEDNDIVLRLKQNTRFKLMPNTVITSSRKYIKYGVFKLQFSYYLLFFLYQLGASQNLLLKTYRHLLSKIS